MPGPLTRGLQPTARRRCAGRLPALPQGGPVRQNAGVREHHPRDPGAEALRATQREWAGFGSGFECAEPDGGSVGDPGVMEPNLLGTIKNVQNW